MAGAALATVIAQAVSVILSISIIRKRKHPFGMKKEYIRCNPEIRKSKTLFVMPQGIAQTFIIRLPMSYCMSIQPKASLTMIGLAAPCATIFGIMIHLIFFIKVSREMKQSGKL